MSDSHVIGAPERLVLGATFSVGMKVGVGYLTRNEVVVFEENRCIAWHHVAPFVWRFDLEEVEGDTRVIESFTYDQPRAFVIIWLGGPERNRRAIRATPRRIEELVRA